LHYLDATAILLYLVSVFIIAFLSRREEILHLGNDEKKIIRSQYLANQSLTWIEVIGSIIATEVSALTFLGVPAFAYSQNFSFVLIYIGAIIGRFVIARFMLPVIYNQGLTVYEAMAKQHPDPKATRRLMAMIYAVSKVLAVGVRLYSGSILVAEFFQMNIYLSIAAVTALTFVYTLFGGLKAVVRTDLLQALVFIVGGLTAYYMIPHVAGSSLTDMWAMASAAHKTSLYTPGMWQELLIGIVGGILFDMATHGVDQDFAQRLMAARSIKTAKSAIFVSSFVSIAIGFLFLGIGALLWSFYQTHPLPADPNPDRLFAVFITTYYPPFLKGLMLAGVLAATMSTLDSTINALSAVLWNDILRHRKVESIKSYLLFDNLGISLALLAVSFWASKSERVLLLGLKIASWSGGALLAFYFSFLIFDHWMKPNRKSWAIALAYLSNIAAVAINTYWVKGPWQFNVYWGFVGAFVCLWLCGRLDHNQSNSAVP
jgi:SSS family solute:Na+ symporter